MEEILKKMAFFYVKGATLRSNPDMWRWVEEHRFLNYTSTFGRELVLTKGVNMTKMETNGRDTSQATMSFIGLKFGTWIA